ncbi:MAG: polysaccharide pyruvyl transferase CsaB [Oscillospiraceae bacterium]|nr:polysaccharide pyruvyl transferase CsaB [Oscillospiraceae bacterium]
MKIMHLISGGDVGGAKTHVHSLLCGLGKTEQVMLVCFTDGPFAEEARALGIPVTIMPGPNLFAVCAALSRKISAEGYEMIHCHGSRANMMGALLRKKIGAPVVTTVHSDYRLDYLGRPLGRLIYGTINAIALRHLDYRIGVSDAMAALLVSRGFDPQRMFSIYNGVDFTPVTPPVSRQAYLEQLGVSVTPQSVIFGIAARLNPVKDIATLIRGFSHCVTEYPDARLLIAGDGEQMQMLQELAAQLCPAGSVTFAGWITDTDSFYNVLDVNTLTSLSETFPYALTEGARMHCATIASNVGGVPQLIDNGVCGLLFQPQDDRTLGGHMLTLCRDSDLRKRLGAALHKKASEQFSGDATVAHQKQIYETILRREARKGRKRDGVLICGAYGKSNAGDDSILDAIIAQMRDIDPDLPLYVLSRTPRKTEQRYRIGAIQTFNLPGCWRRMRKTALYLSGGGSLIQDATSSRSLYYYLENLRLAKKAGNKTMMYGCGIGPVSRPKNRQKAALAIDRYADLITLRETASKLELARMGVHVPEIRVTADPALLLHPAPEELAESACLAAGLRPGTDYLMYAMRPWPGYEQALDAIAKSAEYAFAHYGLTPLLMALEPKRDLPAAKLLAAQLSCPCLIVEAPADGGVIVAMMERMRCVVAMRLHALIFAAGRGVPLVGIVYDPKVSGFLDYIGQTHYAPLSELTETGLCGMLDGALAGGGIDRAAAARLQMLAMQNEDAARALLEETE